MTTVLRGQGPTYALAVAPAVSAARVDALARDPAFAVPWFPSGRLSGEKAAALGGSLGSLFHWAIARALGLPAAVAGPLLSAVIEREASPLGTNGIGRGVAMPHALSDAVDRVSLALIKAVGTTFCYDALDGDPVDLFCLILSPRSTPGAKLRAQEHFVRHAAAFRRDADPDADLQAEAFAVALGIPVPLSVHDL